MKDSEQGCGGGLRVRLKLGNQGLVISSHEEANNNFLCLRTLLLKRAGLNESLGSISSCLMPFMMW